ncbi:MAG: NTP transferase domain-containing protein [Vicinamibacterales bacterium]
MIQNRLGWSDIRKPAELLYHRVTVTRVFVQARMSSKRFPGKVLAPFRGTTVLGHLLARLQSVVPVESLVVATSDDPSDDTLVEAMVRAGVLTYRGPLRNVFARFRGCAQAFPCDWFVRLSADSPLFEPALLGEIISRADADVDLVTNVQTRTFPKGHSVELLRTRTVLALDERRLTDQDREHVTTFFYRHPQEFRIINVTSPNPALATLDLCVDQASDLPRLAALSDTAVPRYGDVRRWPTGC